MKFSFKIITCILFTLLFSACSTPIKEAKPQLLQASYQERGIKINQLGQLEPDIVSDLNIENYYWKPLGKFDQNTLNQHYSLHYSGLLLTIVEKNNKLFVLTPARSVKGNNKRLTALPLLNQELAQSIQQNTQFALNIKQVSSEKSLQLLADTIKKSNNNDNIKVITEGKQKQQLAMLLPDNIALISHLPSQIKTTHLDLLSLCQSLNDEAVMGSYVTAQNKLTLFKKRDISFPELVKVLPHDANFNDLQQQLTLLQQGKYQTFDGKLAKINLQQPKYVPKESALSTNERDKESIQKQGKLIIKINQ